MNESIRLDTELLSILACPICKTSLKLREDSQLQCTNPQCNALYPIVGNVPILINEHNSIFQIKDFTESKLTAYSEQAKQLSLRKRLSRLLPSANQNLKATQNYHEFAKLLQGTNSRSNVLVIGGRVVGNGLNEILGQYHLRFIETDVSIGPRTKIICDAHDLPFLDGTLDGVIIQAVLEHVADPYRCVAEIHRTMRDNGVVYSEIPFMQQVHEGAYDFTRFTHMGNLRLFRHFSEIKSGAVAGPGMALAWAYRYFLLSMFESPTLRAAASVFARLTSFWLRYIDPMLIDKRGTLDAASGYYFLGQKSANVLSDRELVQLYRGLNTLSEERTKVGERDK